MRRFLTLLILFAFLISACEQDEESAEPTRVPVIIGLPISTQEAYTGEPYGITIVGDESWDNVGFYGIVPPEWETLPGIEPRYELRITASEWIVERCKYSALHSDESVEVVRIRIDADATLTDLATNEIISSEYFSGQTPTQCGSMERFDETGTNEHRGRPDSMELVSWLTNALSGCDGLRVSGFVLRGYRFLSARYNPDGTTIVTTISDTPAMRLWDTTTGKDVLVFEETPLGTQYAEFSPDGNLIVTRNLSYARVWDAATGEELAVLSGHRDSVMSVAFSSDGDRIVTAGWDRTVRIWDVQTGEEIRQLTGHQDVVTEAVFSPDSSRIASTSRDGTTRIWDAQTGEELLTMGRRENDGVFSESSPNMDQLAFSPNDSLIVTTSFLFIHVWDAHSGETLLVTSHGSESVLDVAFSPDSRFIVTGGPDKTARVWDVQTGEEVYRIVGHAGSVNSVAFSPDGSAILTASNDNTVRIWKLPDFPDGP